MNNYSSFLLVAFCAFVLSPFASHAFGPHEQYGSCETYFDPRCEVACDVTGGLELGIDFIYWRTRVSDLDYAAHVHTNIDTNGKLLIEDFGKYKFVEPDWESGIRAKVGFANLAGKWDLRGSYTYIEPRETSTTHVENTSQTNSLFATPLFVAPFPLQKASAKYRLSYQSADLLITRSFALACSHMVTPFFGVEWVELDQRFHNRFHGLTAEEKGHVKWKGDYEGAGLKFGTGYHFNFYEGLYIFSKAAASLTVGHSDSHFDKHILCAAAGNISDPGQFNKNTHFKQRQHVFVPGYHIALGLAYEKEFCNFSFGMQIGYEFTTWYGLPALDQPFELGGGLLVDGANNRQVPNVVSTRETNRATIGFHGVLAGLTTRF